MVSDRASEREREALKFVYNFKCQNCRYSRKYGHAKLSAETIATSHGLRLGHTVFVWESNLETLESRICLKVEPEKANRNLFDEPPF